MLANDPRVVAGVRIIRAKSVNDLREGVKEMAIHLARTGSVLEHINTELLMTLLLITSENRGAAEEVRNMARRMGRSGGYAQQMASWAVKKQIEWDLGEEMPKQEDRKT